MALSWNEIKERAVTFSKEWSIETSEDAEAKSFLDDFFNVFGVSRKRIATFETRVKKLNDKDGYIDMLWKGEILIEMKSRGKDLDKAYKQATDYFPGLKEYELPKYILVCDFERFRLYDLVSDKRTDFYIKDFYLNVQLFGFIAGYQKHIYKEQDAVNIDAAELMGKLHDKLKSVGYEGHPLEVYLVRLLFCLFADDTTIFEKDIFTEFIEQRTAEDGSDLAARLSEVFYILNTPPERRLKNIDEQLNGFPYVNGKLFEEMLPHAAFDSQMRKTLLECCALDWGKISPAIFGSMFQSVMNPQERRNLGAHYTSEKNILKLIGPLFLDELKAEFETAKTNKNKLAAFHDKLGKLKFLDPACGCGNFLVITYREIRLLELEIIKQRLKLEGFRQEVAREAQMNVSYLLQCDVDMMYGIEYEEFPARIAEVAMWLMDHQMNMAISQEFGQYFVRLPLKKAASIVHGNALTINWESVINANELSYILGNPPFKGNHYQNEEQKKDMEYIFKGVKGYGVLDYVSAWYLKAAQYLPVNNKITKCAFVSTSSIAQGEQIGLLWNQLLNVYKMKIHFAHRTFKWGNEASGNAAVHVVIIGFSNFDISDKKLFEYTDTKGEPHELKVKNINPYLVDGSDIIITNRSEPINDVPKMIWGNKPTDGGNLLFETKSLKDEFLSKEPNAAKWIRPYISGDDLIQGKFRYCLWLKEISPSELNSLPEVRKRVEAVKATRLVSKASLTRGKASTPTLFVQISQPSSDYLAIPEVSSERRQYIPIGFMSSDVIASNKIQMVPNATLFDFGILTSLMHNCWMRYTCGRLESRYSYSNTIVYNNFPWPDKITNKQTSNIEKAAQRVLDARAEFAESSLSDLYDPLSMPPALTKAHQDLDKAVDLAYRPQPFINETKRMEFLFELYEKYTADLFTKEKVKKKKG